MPEVSIAEKNGLTFEDRCREAHASLNRLSKLLQDVADWGLCLRQKLAEGNGKILMKLAEHERKEGSEFLEALQSARTKAEEQFHKKTWEGGVRLTRDMYGSDATDIALKKFMAEHPTN